MKTLRRAKAQQGPKTKRKPLVGDAPPRVPTQFNELMADPEACGRWVKIAAQCRSCRASFVQCLNSGASYKTAGGPGCRNEPRRVVELPPPIGNGPPLKTKIDKDGNEVPVYFSPKRTQAMLDAMGGTRYEGVECDWRPAAMVIARGSKPWLADMPGAYGPGDVFQAEPGERAYCGNKDGQGQWTEITQRGVYTVGPTGIPVPPAPRRRPDPDPTQSVDFDF